MKHDNLDHLDDYYDDYEQNEDWQNEPDEPLTPADMMPDGYEYTTYDEADAWVGEVDEEPGLPGFSIIDDEEEERLKAVESWLEEEAEAKRVKKIECYTCGAPIESLEYEDRCDKCKRDAPIEWQVIYLAQEPEVLASLKRQAMRFGRSPRRGRRLRLPQWFLTRGTDKEDAVLWYIGRYLYRRPQKHAKQVKRMRQILHPKTWPHARRKRTGEPSLLNWDYDKDGQPPF